MTLGVLEAAAAKSALKVLPFVGKRLHIKYQVSRLEAKAAQKTIIPDPQLVASLSESQTSAILELIQSPAFDLLALQSIVFRVGGTTEKRESLFRDQVRHTLRHTDAFEGADLFQVTDLVVQLLNAASFGASVEGKIPTADIAAIEGQMAAAAARNSSLIESLRNLDNVNRFIGDLRSQVRRLNTDIKISLPGESRSVNFDDLYVIPYLEGAGTRGIDIKTLANRPRWVIQGDPGAGKSTLAAKIAHDIAANLIPRLEDYVVIPLVVRDHTQGLRMEHETLVKYLEASCRHPYNVQPPDDAIEYLLLNGRLAVIIDGLDELGDSRHRRRFADLITSFTYKYPLARVFATSRVVGYREAPLDADQFTVLAVAPFTASQVREYARRWFNLDESIGSDEKNAWVESFLRESAQAADLRQNPLALSLLCALFRTRNSLPRNKPEIYEECAKLLFDMWDRQRGLDVPYHFAAHIRPAVQRIAWQIFIDGRGRQALPRTELRRLLAEYMLIKRFPDADEAIQAADDFLEFCAGRAWVLTEMGSDLKEPHYGFVHRTFLEFFAASQLVKRDPNPHAVWGELAERVTHSQWEVVSQLSVQILDRNHDEGADKLFAILLDQASQSQGNNEWLNFAARALDNVAPSNQILSFLAAAFWNESLSVPLEERRGVHLVSAEETSDGPVATALIVRNPDNIARLGNMLAEQLERRVARASDPSDPSAMIFAALRHASYGYPVGDVLRQRLLERPVPAIVSRWDYELFSPTVGDISRRGIQTMFARSHIPGAEVGSLVFQMLEAFGSERDIHHIRSFERLLESLYHNRTELRLDDVSLGYTFIDREIVTKLHHLKWASLQRLSPESKASLLLLLLAALSRQRYGKMCRQLVKMVRDQAMPFEQLPPEATRMIENRIFRLGLSR